MSGYVYWGLIALVLLGGGLFVHLRYPQGSRGRRRLKWGFWLAIALIIAGFLNYSLPKHDIVRITNTYNRLTTVSTENAWAYASPDVGTGEGTQTRDIRFIDAAFPDGKVIVYRNEDTGWVWPPYFKYDSSNLQAQATNLKSTATTPQWVVVTHYGWRMPWLSIYPNAIKVRAVDGPDVRIIPWGSLIILGLLAIGALMLRRMWMQFRERSIDPALTEAGDVLGDLDARADAARASMRGFWGRMAARLAIWRKGGKV
ncbi:MAG: DUF1523 family protein [Rhodobacteraceae bacterium]|nr:DUF1523 family protein [Paracoccaceae bacterium]